MNSFLLTLISGFSTLLGVIPVFIKFKDIKKIIVCSLSFAGGVMFSISTFDLLFESLKIFSNIFGIINGLLLFLVLFFIGIFIIKIINNSLKTDNELEKVGVLSLVAIIIHNVPEGILTFMMASVNYKLGLSLAIAIALHNIPEGISISVPIYYSINSKVKAFFYTFVAALSEPFGALISFIFFKEINSKLIIGILFSLVCGIMIYLSLFDLVKEAKKYNDNKLLNLFFIIGMIFMFIVLKI